MAIHDCTQVEDSFEYWKSYLETLKLPLKFLYSLRIVGDFALPLDGSSSTEIRDRERYCECYIRSGGFNYLCVLIMESRHAIKKYSDTSLCLECLNLILRILKQCYSVIKASPALQKSLEIDGNQSRICGKVMELIVDAYNHDEVQDMMEDRDS